MAAFFRSAAVLAVVAGIGAGASLGAESEWVHAGPEGKLVYRKTERGDRILDFSFAGYKGGGVALPEVGVKKTVQPLGNGKDNTASIQAAIDEVAKMPMVEGFRGAVLLGPGDFTCSGTLVISASGVVLRGRGGGEGGTTIHMTGSKHRAVRIGRGEERGSAATEHSGGGGTMIADAYVPAGATSFSVEDAGVFQVGDEVAIERPTTGAWVHFMGMDTMYREGKHETWLGEGREEVQQRRIVGIEGKRVTVDVPLSDSYDGRYLSPPGTRVEKVAPAEGIMNVGVEHLRIACPAMPAAFTKAPYSAAEVRGDDCWLRDIDCEETMNAIVLAGKRITAEEVRIRHTYPNLGAAKPGDFGIDGTQILIDRCRVEGDNEYFAWTNAYVTGPNVILNSVFRGRGSRIQPHQRWSTGLLVDNCDVPDGGIDFPNRGEAGSGHGWTMAWAVAWNCVAKTYVIQEPPGAENWAIGCIGERVKTARYFDTGPVLAEGNFDSHGAPVEPASLYVAQLEERMGEGAVRAIGYGEAGTFAKIDVAPLPVWEGKMDRELGRDLAFHRPVNASSEMEKSAAENALDDDAGTWWSPGGDDKKRTLEVDTEGPLAIDTVKLEEGPGSHVEGYRVEGYADGKWQVAAEGGAIGKSKVDRFPETTVWKVRLTIVKAEGPVNISGFELYDAAGR